MLLEAGVKEMYGVQYVPTTIFIDRQGKCATTKEDLRMSLLGWPTQWSMNYWVRLPSDL